MKALYVLTARLAISLITTAHGQDQGIQQTDEEMLLEI